MSASSTPQARRNVMGMRGSYARGICPVETCRASVALATSTGKVLTHGKTTERPKGCPGVGQAPYREPKRKPGAAS